jgi:hypothetical protein
MVTNSPSLSADSWAQMPAASMLVAIGTVAGTVLAGFKDSERLLVDQGLEHSA